MDLHKYIALLDAKLAELSTPNATQPAAQSSKQCQQPPTKPIRRLQDAGYKFELDTDNALWKGNNNYLISLPDAARKKFIVSLAIDVSQGMMIIHEAWNRSNDTLKTMKLRDMIMSVWKFEAKQDVTALKWIKYQTVVEEYGFEHLAEIYKKNLPEGQEDLYIPRTGGWGFGKLPQAYCKLILHFPFAIAAKKMLAEYSAEEGRKVDAFIISKSHRGFHNFSVYLGSSAIHSDQPKDKGTRYDEGSVEQKGVYHDGGGGTLCEYLKGLRERLYSQLDEDEWVLLSPKDLEGWDTFDDDWVLVGPDDWRDGGTVVGPG